MIPVALFAYTRPHHLRETLSALRTNQVPTIYAFSDGPRTPEKEPAVAEVRALLHAIDWCDIRLIERDQNLGLGLSIRTGVAEVLRHYESVIVVEDDLICVPGTYQYLCAALNHYQDDERVMSVTGWTHPQVTPSNLNEQPYFDGRAECWIWGTWARVWDGMDRDAKTLMHDCERRGIDIFRYGADLVDMAGDELARNIWAVRFLYLHILKGGLCLRPPHSMVQNIGFGGDATNTLSAAEWGISSLQSAPSLPALWPEPTENAECSVLWQRMYGRRQSTLKRIIRSARKKVITSLTALLNQRN